MRVTGITISREQLEFARARLQPAGLADRVDLQFCDYRDIEGSYDHIVSIEMIEAVGERYWPDYFADAEAPRRARRLGDRAGDRDRRRLLRGLSPSPRLHPDLHLPRRHAAVAAAYRASNAGAPASRSPSSTVSAWTMRIRSRRGSAGSTRSPTRSTAGLRRAIPPDVAVLPRLLCRRLLDPPHRCFAGALPPYIRVGNDEAARPRSRRTGRLSGGCRIDRERLRRARQSHVQTDWSPIRRCNCRWR